MSGTPAELCGKCGVEMDARRGVDFTLDDGTAVCDCASWKKLDDRNATGRSDRARRLYWTSGFWPIFAWAITKWAKRRRSGGAGNQICGRATRGAGGRVASGVSRNFFLSQLGLPRKSARI